VAHVQIQHKKDFVKQRQVIFEPDLVQISTTLLRLGTITYIGVPLLRGWDNLTSCTDF